MVLREREGTKSTVRPTTSTPMDVMFSSCQDCDAVCVNNKHRFSVNTDKVRTRLIKRRGLTWLRTLTRRDRFFMKVYTKGMLRHFRNVYEVPDDVEMGVIFTIPVHDAEAHAADALNCAARGVSVNDADKK